MRKSELKEMWDKAVQPTKKELDGCWAVESFGKASITNVLHDKKLIKNGVGHNEIGELELGYFVVEKLDNAIILNYGFSKNPYPLTHVVDQVRKVDDSTMIGKFFFKMKHEFWFIMKRSALTEQEEG